MASRPETPRRGTIVSSWPGPAAGEGALDQESFSQCCLGQNLGFSLHECRCIFRRLADEHGAPGCVALPAAAIVRAIRGQLPAQRLAAVREAWARVAPAGRGEVSSQELLAKLDVRRLPTVLSGEVSTEAARRQILQGLDLCGERTAERSSFALEEAYARRRPMLVGVLGTPRDVPAGRPRKDEGARVQGDIAREVSGRPPLVHLDASVSFADFEAYYTLFSTVTPDDDIFLASVEAAWGGKAHLYEAAQASRAACRPRSAAKPPACTRVLATFEDGSSRLVILRNDEGIELYSGQAGSTTNQLWTWGAGVYPEVKRRLQEQGIEGIQSIKLAPF